MAVRGGGGAYAKRNRAMQRERERRIAQRQNDSAQSSRERAHTLSLETTLRQRAMEDRKLVMLAAEEERKQRILNERKQFHREATVRFRQATERCKIGPGAEHAITMLPPSGISIGTTTDKLNTASPVASPNVDWESSLVVARSNSAKRILNKKDSETFKPKKIDFPPLNPKQSLTSNEGAVPIRRPNGLPGGHNGLSRAHSLSSVYNNASSSQSNDQSGDHPLTRSSSLKQLHLQPTPPPPLPPTAVPVGPGSKLEGSVSNLSYSERARLSFRNRSRKIYSSNSSLYSSSGSLDTISLESTSSDTNERKVRFASGYDEGQKLENTKTGYPIAGIMKKQKSQIPTAPPMTPAQDDDSFDSLSDHGLEDNVSDEATTQDGVTSKDAKEAVHKESSRNASLGSLVRNRFTTTIGTSSAAGPGPPASTGSGYPCHPHSNHSDHHQDKETHTPKWRQMGKTFDKDELVNDDDTDSFDSQKTTLSESELDKTQEDTDRERPPIPDESAFDRPWKITTGQEGEDFQKAERMRREAVGGDMRDLDKPKCQYGVESLRLISAASDSSSESSKNELDKSLPPPAPQEPVGILKKPQKIKLSKGKSTGSFYIDLMKEKAGYANNSRKSESSCLPKKVRFDDAVRSAHIEYVEPLQDNPPVRGYPEEQDFMNPLDISSLIQTYNLTPPAPKYVVVPPTHPDEATANMTTTEDDRQCKNSMEKRESGKEVYDQPPEKPKYVVESEELDEEKVWRDVEKCLMSEEKSPPKPKIPKYPRFKQVETAGIQPSLRIDTNAPPSPHTFNGHPQVSARYARELAGTYPDSEKIDAMLVDRTTSSRPKYASKIPAPPKKLLSRQPRYQSHQAKEQQPKRPQLVKQSQYGKGSQLKQTEQGKQPQQAKQHQQAKQPQQPKKPRQPKQPQQANQSQLLPNVRQPSSEKRPSSAKRPLTNKQNSSTTKLPSIKQPSSVNQNSNINAAPSRRARSEVDLSLEEQKIKESIERINAELKGYPGSASLIGSRGCDSTYHVNHPIPNPSKPQTTYFTKHKRMNYGRKLYNPNLDDDYF